MLASLSHSSPHLSTAPPLSPVIHLFDIPTLTVFWCLQEMSTKPMEDQVNPMWQVDQGHITMDSLGLVGLQHISMDSQQVRLRWHRHAQWISHLTVILILLILPYHLSFLIFNDRFYHSSVVPPPLSLKPSNPPPVPQLLPLLHLPYSESGIVQPSSSIDLDLSTYH